MNSAAALMVSSPLNLVANQLMALGSIVRISPSVLPLCFLMGLTMAQACSKRCSGVSSTTSGSGSGTGGAAGAAGIPVWEFSSCPEGTTGGAGGGVKVTPIAFLIIKDGNVRLLPVGAPANTTADRIVEQVPDLLDKVAAFVDSRTNKENA